MEKALENFLRAGWQLVEVWDESKVTTYPGYLPSFDEFLTQFTHLMMDSE